MANLEIDCKIGKDRHFIAADRKNRYRIYLGLFAVIGSAIIASGIGASILSLIGGYFSDQQKWKLWEGVFVHVLPLLVGISTAILGFLGLEKQTAQHRYVGNSYIEIARKTRSIINSISGSDSPEQEKKFELLLNEYLEVNKEGESCPTNDRDSKKAMSMNSRRRSSIKKKVEEYDLELLGISPSPKKYPFPGFWIVIRKNICLKAMAFFTWIGMVRGSDFRAYLKRVANR